MKQVNRKQWLPYLVIILGIFYGMWPIDLLPDIPLIGWVDDLGILGGALVYFLRYLVRRKQETKRSISKEKR